MRIQFGDSILNVDQETYLAILKELSKVVQGKPLVITTLDHDKAVSRLPDNVHPKDLEHWYLDNDFTVEAAYHLADAKIQPAGLTGKNDYWFIREFPSLSEESIEAILTFVHARR